MNKIEYIEIINSKKIGLIADVHGNYEYLKIVIQNLLLKDVTHFIFLGDMITDFQDTKKIIDFIKELQKKYNINFILGNREIDMLERRLGNRASWQEELQNGNLLLTYNDLTVEDLDWLASFGEHIIIRFPNREKALVTHMVDDNNVKKIVDSNDIHIVISAHTHRACDDDNRKDNGIWYINPGSVGLTEEGISYGGTYGILEVNDRQVCYHQQKFIAKREIIEKVYQNLSSNKKLQKSYWDIILDLSMQTGRNMAAIYFREVQRLTGIYSADEKEKIANGFYKPLPLNNSMITGYNHDINNNLLSLTRIYQTLQGDTFINKKVHKNSFDSNMAILNNSEIRKQIYRVALNNLIYYATIGEKSLLSDSKVLQEKQIKYKTR